jgi:hypothetical protein
VTGTSRSGSGISGTSDTGTGVAGVSTSGIGVVGISGSLEAGVFLGTVTLTGTLSKGAGSFKIDHPLDPANKYLCHSFVESPDMKNVYDGMILLDDRGEAFVELPAWCEALNRDFRYQLTAIGVPARDLHIAMEVSNNRFKIAGGSPGMKVSWQITGIRRDPYAINNPILVEEEKSAKEQGYFLHPGVYGQPEDKGIEWARYPEMMRRLKDQKK